jgi:hypothetical protein
MANNKKKRLAKIRAKLPPNTEKGSLVGSPRVSFLATTHNISAKTLIEFLVSKGYIELKINSLLDKNAIKLVEKHFKLDKDKRDKVRGTTEVRYGNPKPEGTIGKKSPGIGVDDTSKEIREPILHLTHNLFKKVQQDIYFKGLKRISSRFLDDQALDICSKMSSSYTRRLCKDFQNKNSDREFIRYQIHYIANKAFEIFGGKFLTFIYELRKLKFKNQTANEISTHQGVIPDFPLLSLEAGGTSFIISFFVKRNKKKNTLNRDVRLLESKTYNEIGTVDEDGCVITRLEKFKPEISLFYQKAMNNTFKIYSGVETGNCDICGKELNHPVSLRLGIGPVCARNLQIDKALYVFK